jgi:hypothetical protein
VLVLFLALPQDLTLAPLLLLARCLLYCSSMAPEWAVGCYIARNTDILKVNKEEVGAPDR